MKRVIGSEALPIKMWLDDMEEGAFAQAKNLANLPFAFKHIAIMPDSHQGYGMPIGGVLAAKNVIVPNAVGVDIGCGMCAVRTNLREMEEARTRQIVKKIKESIPVGFEWHEEPRDERFMPERESPERTPIVHQQYSKARRQVGTLGGGNHFIEIQRGSDGFIWIMIHSGSRNLGKRIADHYNRIAVQLNERWCSSVPKKHQLAFLPIETPEAKQYRHEMDYCVQFALANRQWMMERVQEVFLEILRDATYEPMINIAHNYAAMENHFNRNVMIHRKGATRAREGQLGIIPGSQGTRSYIVKGKGNRDSFASCSHGAGRKLGRKQAIRELDLEKERTTLEEKGIIHSIAEAGDLDEAPGAYKDIDVVMENQKDLVEIVVALEPLAVIKG